MNDADIAQLAELPICNRTVEGSTPSVSNEELFEIVIVPDHQDCRYDALRYYDRLLLGKAIGTYCPLTREITWRQR